jgi:oligopeptide/dipeptide ABC transporter ATP-binding protein
MALLSVRNLETHFFTEAGVVPAVNQVSFAVHRGEVLCIVGESGSGKSVACLSILGLVPDPPGRIVGGEILFRAHDEGEPEDLTQANKGRLREIRGDRIAMVFQDPMTSLNPYLKVGTQLSEVLAVHQGLTGAPASKQVVDMLGDVGLPAPERRLNDYPHQLSGGMRQRVMIAMALLCQPDVLIADEPTTALDVTIQAQILALLEERKRSMGLAVLLITHDLGVVAKMADRVAVMVAGQVVEQGSVDAIFRSPRHPYTVALQRSIPRIDDEPGRGALRAIKGLPPAAGALPSGCPFHPRCDRAVSKCTTDRPIERELEVTLDGRTSSHRVACHNEAPQAPGDDRSPPSDGEAPSG